MKLTDAKLKAIRAGEKSRVIWEGSGFGLRVSPTGAKSFVLMFRMPGSRKARLWTIGKYPQITLAAARRMAAQGREKILKGIDPGARAVVQRKADREAYTVKDLAEEYLEKWARPRKRSAREDERILHKDVVPAWGNRKAKDITRRDIILLLDAIVERGATIQANRTLAVVRKMFNFAAGRSILDASPCVAITAPARENRRDRVLSEAEIKSFWNGLDTAGMSEAVKLALKFQLTTAQRKGEVAGAEWRDFDLKSTWWVVPGEKTKNAMPHRVPLSPLALGLLGEIKALSNGSPFLFPSPRNGRHITGPAIDHAVRVNHDVFGIEHFTPHDLRRTAASLMTGAGIPRLIVSKILNHAEPGVTAVYDRHSYDAEKRQAFETWGRKLESILTGKTGKVIPLQAK